MAATYQIGRQELLADYAEDNGARVGRNASVNKSSRAARVIILTR